jgi:hypothetical protein
MKKIPVYVSENSRQEAEEGEQTLAKLRLKPTSGASSCES